MEFNACCLPLSLPSLIVGVEYPVTKKIMNSVSKEWPFWKIGKLGLEKMLEITRVRGDNAVEGPLNLNVPF